MGLSAKEKFDGKQYQLKDALSTKDAAKSEAEDWRNQPDPMWLSGDRNVKYLARVKDGGEEAGRLRYGVYTRLEVYENGKLVKSNPSTANFNGVRVFGR